MQGEVSRIPRISQVKSNYNYSDVIALNDSYTYKHVYNVLFYSLFFSYLIGILVMHDN